MFGERLMLSYHSIQHAERNALQLICDVMHTLGASSRAAFCVSESTAALLTAYAGAPGTARFAAVSSTVLRNSTHDIAMLPAGKAHDIYARSGSLLTIKLLDIMTRGTGYEVYESMLQAICTAKLDAT